VVVEQVVGVERGPLSRRVEARTFADLDLQLIDHHDERAARRSGRDRVAVDDENAGRIAAVDSSLSEVDDALQSALHRPGGEQCDSDFREAAVQVKELAGVGHRLIFTISRA
jgi:hypothetical protein